jgi:hypothetical protein
MRPWSRKRARCVTLPDPCDRVPDHPGVRGFRVWDPSRPARSWVSHIHLAVERRRHTCGRQVPSRTQSRRQTRVASLRRHVALSRAR